MMLSSSAKVFDVRIGTKEAVHLTYRKGEPVVGIHQMVPDMMLLELIKVGIPTKAHSSVNNKVAPFVPQSSCTVGHCRG